MTTPICDFVCRYARSGSARLHMPGHKGNRLLGPEARDITEIEGADVLYSARGIIRESEKNAAALFGSQRTVYSTEGSSLCIRAMVYLAVIHAGLRGRRARIAAGRNAHRVFLEAAALHWIDLLDARMNEMKTVEDRTPPGAFSEKIMSLDGRRMYHPLYEEITQSKKQ